MKEVILEAMPREISTKHALKSSRIQGKIPAVFYGHNEKNLSLEVAERKFGELMSTGMGGNVLITLKIGTDTKMVIIKEIQRDVITNHPIHIDFQAVSLKEKIELNVPLHIVGIAPGVKLSGGVLETLLREVRVKCLPTQIPESINVDVSTLEINHSIAVKDLPKPEGVEIISDPHSIIVNVVAPTVLEEAPAPGTPEAAAATAAAEPEVISKGKKEEEGAEAAAPAEQPKAPGKK